MHGISSKDHNTKVCFSAFVMVFLGHKSFFPIVIHSAGFSCHWWWDKNGGDQNVSNIWRRRGWVSQVECSGTTTTKRYDFTRSGQVTLFVELCKKIQPMCNLPSCKQIVILPYCGAQKRLNSFLVLLHDEDQREERQWLHSTGGKMKVIICMTWMHLVLHYSNNLFDNECFWICHLCPPCPNCTQFQTLLVKAMQCPVSSKKRDEHVTDANMNSQRAGF